MRRSISSICVVVALLTSDLIFVPLVKPQDVESVAAGAKLSVAVILAKIRARGVAKPTVVVSGSGFLVADRLVVTALHVVQGATGILLKFTNLSPVEAHLVQSDKQNDVAVLSIPHVPVHPLPLGDVRLVREGQTVIVIGYPRIEALGAETPTITEGIVSAIRPAIIQMQVPVSPGNSGGPVLNLQGQVVGIVRATLQGRQQGINFATTIDAAKPLLEGIVSPSPTSPPQPQPAAPTPVPSSPQAQFLTVKFVEVRSPVPHGGEGLVTIQTKPDTWCSIAVIYMSGPSTAQSLIPQVADADGRITWTWKVGTRTTPGTWPIIVECGKGDVTRVQTSFEVI